MDLFLTEELVLFRESVAKFARNELASGALQRAQSDDYPRDVARLIAEQGLIGITLSEADGGQGGSLLDAVIAIEQVALACPRSADIVQAGNFGAIRTFAEYGTADQKKRYLPGLLAGEDVIAVAMTEPDAGSALTELSTSARRDGNGYRLNGSKIFTTNSRHASLFLAYVRFGPGVAGIGSILVERDTPGLEFGKPSRFMNGEEWQQLHFDDCYVAEANVLLPAGGFKRQIKGFNVERIGNSARSLALGRLAFNLAREHAETRRQFGRALCDFQGIQWKFAEMAIKLEAAQLLLYKAATHPANELPSAYDTAIAKVACNRAGFEIANEALQTMGGHGFSCESLVQYCMRRTRGWMIAGGSIEVLLNRISESVFDRRFSQRVQQEAAE